MREQLVVEIDDTRISAIIPPSQPLVRPERRNSVCSKVHHELLVVAPAGA